MNAFSKCISSPLVAKFPARRLFLTQLLGLAATTTMGGIGIARGGEVKKAKTLKSILEEHLLRTEVCVKSAVDKGIKPVQDIFEAARANTRAFAGDAMGWRAKGHVAWDFVPCTSKKSLERYLEFLVGKHLFTRESIEASVERGVTLFSGHIEECENKMLVDLLADINELPGNIQPKLGTPAAFAEKFRETISDTRRFAGKWNGVEAGALLAGALLGSIVQKLVVNVIAAVLRKFGFTSTLVGAGSAGGLIGLMVGLVIDCLVSWLMDWWFDPRGNLARDLSEKMTEMEELIVKGKDSEPGMQNTLQAVLDSRNKLRRAALELLILGKK